ncbi:hypothetical protein PILCRDRAFT_810842, partial [Piloderma croceum F 1598]
MPTQFHTTPSALHIPPYQPPFPPSYLGSDSLRGLISLFQRPSPSSHENLPTSNSASAKWL